MGEFQLYQTHSGKIWNFVDAICKMPGNGDILLKRALIFSLILHLGPLLFTGLVLRNSVENVNEAPPIEVTTIATSNPTGPITSTSGRFSAPASGRLTLSDLGIAWKNGLPGEVDLTAPDSAGPGESEILNEIKGTVIYDSLYRLIDETLYYPAEFGEGEIEGVVRAQIVFSKNGTYNRKFSRVSSPSPYLRVFVLQLLRRAFSEPLPAAYRKSGNEIRISTVFFFDLTRTDNPMDAGPNAMKGHDKNRSLGRHFAFYRSAKLIGEWKIGPLRGYGLVPSVAVDPEWFVDRATDLVSEKAKADPLKKYRDDPEYGREG